MILPTLPPTEEINVIAKLVAIVMRVGIFKTVNIIGTSKNPPAAPTIPEPIPTINANEIANALLNVITDVSSTVLRGINIITAAIAAKIPYTIFTTSSDKKPEP